MPAKHIFTEDQIKEITSVEVALKSASDPWEKRRLTVILLSLKKVPMKTIMHETQYSDVHIRRLREEYIQKGLDKYLAHTYRPYSDERLWSKDFTPEQIQEVQKAYETVTHPVLARRYKVVLLRMQGMANKQAAKETGMAKSTAADTFCAYKKGGLAALQAHAASKIYSPRASKFTEEQTQEVLQAFYHARRLKDQAKLEILVLRSRNKTFQEIHEATGFSMGAITREINNYLQHGLPKSPHGGGYFIDSL